MSDPALDDFARAAGLILERPDEYAAPVDDDTKRIVAERLGPLPGEYPTPSDRAAYVPPVLDERRVFGLAVQMYQLRSPRNLGIGDLGDVRAFVPMLAAAGADFIGLNPIHALFSADPERASPFSPSDRRFLNPYIIAADAITGYDPVMVDAPVPDAAERIHYAAVGRLKMAVLERAFHAWRNLARPDERAEFDRFTAERGDGLQSFATFEAISHAMVAAGGSAGSQDWPSALATRSAPGVAAFAAANRPAIAFHAWLQFIADRQLKGLQEAALGAGMRIGLYLDLAVGSAPDGHAAWADPDLVVKGLTVGAPPDLFSTEGQSWGLAPISPAALMARDYAPYRTLLAAVMRHAGAVRIDHAMGLERLWLLPDGQSARYGVYVRQPGLIDEVVCATHRHQTLAVGEDLGIVPPGFRERMIARRIYSMRIMMFEREWDGMRPPEAYPEHALACLSTHDFAPLEAYWAGDDLAIREALGTLSWDDREKEAADRGHLKRMLCAVMGFAPEVAEAPLSDEVRIAYHRAVAATSSRMMAVRLEDVVGGRRLVNLPGTDREHPNWRHTLPLRVDEVVASSVLAAVLAAVRVARG